MSVARILTADTTIALSKVIPLHNVVAQEEQVKSTDQGNIAARKRRNVMPASDQVKVPANEAALQQELMAKFNALSPDEKAKVAAKLQASAATILEQFPKLLGALRGTSGSKDQPAFNAWDSSILMLYTHFAEEQMNQNGMIMNGWQAQQQAQNQVLQETAHAEGVNAKKDTTSTTASWWKCLLIALAVAVTVIIAAVVTVATLGTALPALGAAAIAGTAAVLGGGAFAASYITTNNEAKADPKFASGLTSTGPDEQLIQMISNLNIFYNTISQKTNNSISTGSQTNLVNASSNDTQMGQQAAQIIQAMGRTMNTKGQ